MAATIRIFNFKYCVIIFHFRYKFPPAFDLQNDIETVILQYFTFVMKYITNMLTISNPGNKLIVSTTLILLVACQHHKPAEIKASLVNKDSAITKSFFYMLDMVVNQKDLACYMPLKEGIGDTVHYHGKVYGFCSKECKNEFLSRPSYYVNDQPIKLRRQ